ncbi:MAG TPA: hypothetical protein VK541_18530 [Pedobacter sp.]|uniref:hypothetical protein n=1 Tax=Pedobacter sp. TaxID=1411316 RepID=UPI002CA9832D|nr:hypothetical protein [Pedobacter sp.]HMI04493.1 hypothetical protein [Pedobacter sp.]
MLTVVVCLPVVAQLKNGAHRASFYGEWKLNKSKSELAGQFPVCIFGEGDGMFSNTMKITGYKDFLAGGQMMV